MHDTLFFPVEWDFPLPNQLLLHYLFFWGQEELQRSHHLGHCHQDEVVAPTIIPHRWIGLANNSAIDNTGDSMGMGVQAGKQTLSFESLLLDVLGYSSIWPSDISTAASVMRWSSEST